MFQVQDDDFKKVDQGLLEGGDDANKAEFETKVSKVADMSPTMAIVILVLNFCFCPLGTLVASCIDKKGCNKPLAVIGVVSIAIVWGVNFLVRAVATASNLATMMNIFYVTQLVFWCYHLFIAFKNYQYNAKHNADMK